MSDRIVIIRDGRKSGEFRRSEMLSEHQINDSMNIRGKNLEKSLASHPGNPTGLLVKIAPYIGLILGRSCLAFADGKLLTLANLQN
jgi:ABC-type sugar transport system ATPase subunit